MDEFLKINWKLQDLTQLQGKPEFISDEALTDSLIFKSFDVNLNDLYSDPFKDKKGDKGLLCTPKNNKDSYFFLTKEKSTLLAWQQENCLKALKLLQSGKPENMYTEKEQNYITTYNKCKEKLVKENELYQKIAYKHWKTTNKRKMLTEYSEIIATNYWKNQCERYLQYPPFYKDFKLLQWSYVVDDGEVAYNCSKTVLEVGTMAKFMQPSLKFDVKLSINAFPDLTEKYYNSQLPVSQDRNIDKILEKESQISVVLSGSSLKRIFDNTSLDVKWDMPVVVKVIRRENANGQIELKKVVFIDKPLPLTNPNKLAFAKFCTKQTLKTTLCEYEAFSYPNTDIPLNSDPNKKLQQNNEKKKIHHNAHYRIWNIKKTVNNQHLMKTNKANYEMNILIRNKMAGCEKGENSSLVPVIVRPKIEQQLMFGGNIPTKTDLCKEWSSLFFNPFADYYRVRVASFRNDVAAIEKCDLQKIGHEAAVHHRYTPNLGLGVLEKVLSGLQNLDAGDYLLHHGAKQGPFISLMQKCPVEIPGGYSLKEVYSDCRPNKTVNDIPWLPIDVTYILPNFEANNRMPGTFRPVEWKEPKRKFKKKKKK